MKLVSIIIPVYKTEIYLDKCIESVVNQTYKNIEIILINDGSPDNSHVICEKWANKDERIVVHKKENAGLSSARNTGIDISKGEYIIFIDSDDYVEKELVEKLYSSIEKYNVDIVSCKYKDVDEYYNNITRDSMSNFKLKFYKKYVGVEYLNFILKGEAPPTAWAKIYCREFIGENRFVLGSHCEDSLYLFEHLKKDSSALFIPDVLYNYLMRDDSITSKFSEKTYNDRIIASKIFEKRAYEEIYELRENASVNKYLMLIRFISHMPYSFVEEKNKTYLSVINEIKENLGKILLSSIKFRFKLYVLTFIVSPKIANKIVSSIEHK